MARKENPRPGVAMGRGVGIAAGHGANDSITAAPRESRRDRAPHGLLTELRTSYPVLGEYRPLSIGIRAALDALLPGVPRKRVGRALAMHCHSDAYLRALAAGGPRYGLDGAPSGEVSEEHRAAAALVLARRAETAAKPPNATPARPVLRLAKPRRQA